MKLTVVKASPDDQVKIEHQYRQEGRRDVRLRKAHKAGKHVQHAGNCKLCQK